MNRYLLDTSALLTLRDNEVGAEQVAAILYEAQKGQSVCLGCSITLMELLYRVWKDEGETAGRLAYEQCYALPIEWIHEEKLILEKAAELKTNHAISLADAWIAAAAMLQEAELVHKDPELALIPCPQQTLLYKK
ncbi:MAG: PIN domain-containing protein [Anaerolineales bacterium]|nr:PIN domain-containing protein [Anaerolineales bacterium]